MNDPFVSDPELPSIAVQGQLFAICDRFESAWRAGEKPLVETFVAEGPDSYQTFLLHKLLRLEIELRRTAGDLPKPTEYRERFPNDAVTVESVFASELLDTPSQFQSSIAPVPLLNSPESASGNSWLGRTIAGYEILNELGRGGMGIVYRARQIKADRIVAMKCIRPDLLDGLSPKLRDEAIVRFQTEARAAAKLEHEHLVTVYDVGEVEGRLYYSMRFINGDSLATKLRNRTYTGERAAEILIPVAQAVHHAHLNGIIHRDPKPGNILLDHSNQGFVAHEFWAGQPG